MPVDQVGLPTLPFDGSVDGGSLLDVVDEPPDDDDDVDDELPDWPGVGVEDARLSRDAPPLDESVDPVLLPELLLELDELPDAAAALARPDALPADGLFAATVPATESTLLPDAVAAALTSAAATAACCAAGKAPTAALAIWPAASG